MESVAAGKLAVWQYTHSTIDFGVKAKAHAVPEVPKSIEMMYKRALRSQEMFRVVAILDVVKTM